MQNKKLSPVALTSIIIGVVALIVIIFSISTYNGLAKQEQNVEAKWSEVENKMQRQADLIPSVVSTVKAQMSHEEKKSTRPWPMRARRITPPARRLPSPRPAPTSARCSPRCRKTTRSCSLRKPAKT